MPATYASKTCGYRIVCLALLCASMLSACESEAPARDVGKPMPQQEAADSSSPADTTRPASSAGSTADTTPSAARFGELRVDVESQAANLGGAVIDALQAFLLLFQQARTLELVRILNAILR